MIVCVMQESVFAIVIVFFFLLPLDAVSAQKGIAIRSRDRFLFGYVFGIHDERFSICWMIWFLAVLMSCFYLSENVTGTIIRVATGGLGKGLACLMACGPLRPERHNHWFLSGAVP